MLLWFTFMYGMQNVFCYVLVFFCTRLTCIRTRLTCIQDYFCMHFLLSVLGSDFQKYMDAFKPFLGIGLKNYAEYQVGYGC